MTEKMDTKSKTEYVAPKEGSKLFNKYFCIILLMGAAVNFANYIVGSAFSLWVIDAGGTNTTYGVIHSLYSLVILLARPVAGWIIDHGNRRQAFIAASVIFVASMFLMLYSPVFGIFIGARLVMGAGNGCAVQMTNTVGFDYMPKDKMDRGIGYVTLCSSLMSALTATISVGTYKSQGPSALVWMSAAAMAVAVALSFLLVMRIPEGHGEKFRLKDVFDLSKLFEVRSVKPALISAFSTYFGFGLRSYVILYGRSLGFANPGWFTTASALGLLVVRFALDRIPVTEKSKDRRVYLAFAVFVVYLVTISLCRSFVVYIIAALLWSVLFGILTPTLQSIAIKAAPAERRGAASSTFHCASDIGIIIGSFLGGKLSDLFGYSKMFLFGLIPVALAFIYYFITLRDRASDK